MSDRRLGVFLPGLILLFVWTAAASAQTTTYKWSAIDCGQSRIALWPGLRCNATNVVTTEGNIGAFRRWSAYGTTGEGYVHIFLWEAQNAFSYIVTDETTVEFLKWVHANGRFTRGFSPVARFHDADWSRFTDEKLKQSCAGFRRTGNPRRGGYDWIVGGILCAPPGKTLTQDQLGHFIDRVHLR